MIAVDQKPEGSEAKLATYIATDSVKAADELCTWMFKQMGGKGEIGILQGVLGSTAELQRSQGCQQALDRTPGIKVAAKQAANWDETEGYKAAQNMLQANPDIKAIFGESDAMGLGAAKAAKDANREIIAVGIDGHRHTGWADPSHTGTGPLQDGAAGGIRCAQDPRRPAGP